MRICTITCHDVYNAGASLQAYALQTYLADLGHDVRIIDYKPPYLSSHFRFTTLNNSVYDKPFFKQAYLLAKLPSRLRALPKKWAFDAFTKQYLRLTKRYCSAAALEAEPPEAEIFFAGSDQIWNPTFPNGKDSAFYLAFVKQGIRASYAASFAVDDFPAGLSETTAQMLSTFQHISVREPSGLHILEKLGIQDAAVVLDPVFLLPRERWENLAVVLRNCKEPYLLVYDFDNRTETIRIAKKIADEHGLKVYSIFRSHDADRCFPNCGPLEFLGLVKNADFVLSNSFHATAFSVIFQREFAVVRRKDNLNSRMRDFVELLGMPERMLAADAEIETAIDWSAVSARLEEAISYSKAFINQMLDTVENEESTVCN